MIYIPEILSTSTNIRLQNSSESYNIYRELVVNESFHVAEEIYDIAKDIFSQIKSIVNEIDDLVRDYNGIMSMYETKYNKVYTGWNIRSFQDIKNLENANKSFFIKCDDEKKYTPIYFSLNKSNQPKNFMGSSSIRWIYYPGKNQNIPLKTYISKQDNSRNEEAIIYINHSYFLRQKDESIPSNEESTWVGVISHELQHLLEQFVNKENNNILQKPNSIETYFRVDSTIIKDINSIYYKNAEFFIHHFALEEQRARSTQIENILKEFINSSEYRYQIYSIYYNHLKKRNAFGLSQDEPIRMMTISLMSHPLIKYVHNILELYNGVSFIASKSNYYDENSAKCILLLGYYFNLFKIFKTNDEQIQKFLIPNNINSILNNEGIEWIDSDDYKITRQFVIDNLIRIYYNYEHTIYKRIERHASDFIDRIGINVDLKDNKETSYSQEFISKKERQLLENIQNILNNGPLANHGIHFLKDGRAVII